MEEALQRGLGGGSSGGAAAQNGESPPAARPGGGGPACLPSSVSPDRVRRTASNYYLRLFKSSIHQATQITK